MKRYDLFSKYVRSKIVILVSLYFSTYLYGMQFLNFYLWQGAIDLLNFQVEQRRNNKHYNTLSMYFYEKFSKSSKFLKTEKYFKTYIESNLFYSLDEVFFTKGYQIPKSKFTLRKYTFFSYPMRVLYYAIGLYIFNISSDLLSEYINKIDSISSFYGGKIKIYYKNKKICLSKKNLYYLKFYKDFRHKIKSQIQDSEGNLLESKDLKYRVCIRLDIQDYFESIPIGSFLQHLNNYIKPSIKNKFSYDSCSIEEIRFFFEFLSAGKTGIPQADNDIISSFLGYLYLIFADIWIDEILKDQPSLEEHKIIRYVDDIYVFLIFKEELNEITKNKVIVEVSQKISDVIYYKLKLKINSQKTSLYRLHKEEDRKKILENLVSPEQEVNSDREDDEVDTESPTTKIQKIFKVIEQIKQDDSDLLFGDEQYKARSKILRESFLDKSVLQMLSQDEYITKLGQALNGYNFDLVKVYSLELMILILKNPKIESQFSGYLNQKNTLDTLDSYLILRF
ncbi:hypothetical protein AY599_06730, partial [Leptolyngbya valderiana BDU 20041]